MIVRGFKQVLWVGAVGGAALSCYMVSLRVATERADLVRVEHQIVDAKRDIRTLQTELGTRGRLAQLEDWNSNVLALSAPSSAQYVKDAYTLARLQTHEPTVEDRTSDVRMAAMETGEAAPAAKPEGATKPAAPAAQDKAAKPVPPAPETSPLPRVVQAVAPAPAHPAPLVRRASYVPGASVVAEITPARAVPQPARPRPAATHATPASAAAPAATKKVRTAAKPETPVAAPKHASHEPVRTAAADKAVPVKLSKAGKPVRTAAADKPAPAKPGKPTHGPAKLAHADTPARPASSGHRGGAQ